MQPLYDHYLQFIRSSLKNDTSFSGAIPEEEQASLAALAEEHRTVPFVLPGFRNTSFYPAMLQKTKNMMQNYYQIDAFTRHTVSLLEENGIPCILLKGISLAACYPVPEYRKLGDLDLYINEPKALEKAKALLEAQGYKEEKELSDHHVTYRYTFPKTGRSFLLELHYRVVGMYQYEPANQTVDEVYSPLRLKPIRQTINGFTYSVLPPTEYVFYMIHHMLKHYLYSGFGIRLLCDFVLYLKRYEKEIDFSRIHQWCKASRISHLYEIILKTCRLYLDLPASIDPAINASPETSEAFLIRILEDGDMGTDVSQALVGSGSYRKINLLTYFREGHVQMKVRFPKAGHCPLLWPALWPATFFYFLKNTYTLRNTTLRQTLKDFRKSNQKTTLIRIFENSDS